MGGRWRKPRRAEQGRNRGLLADAQVRLSEWNEIAKVLAKAGLGQIKGGTLYPVLNRLEEAGLVAAEYRVAERGPGRRYYNLTDEGRATLAEQGALWLAFDGSVRDVLAQGGIR